MAYWDAERLEKALTEQVSGPFYMTAQFLLLSQTGRHVGF